MPRDVDKLRGIISVFRCGECGGYGGQRLVCDGGFHFTTVVPLLEEEVGLWIKRMRPPGDDTRD